MTDIIEECARDIAAENGDDYYRVPKSKGEWMAKRGIFAGEVRDINAPFKCDYDAMAIAAMNRLRQHLYINIEGLTAIKDAEERRK